MYIIPTYETLYKEIDGEKVNQSDRVQVFIPYNAIKENDVPSTIKFGNQIHLEAGITRIVDKYIEDTLDIKVTLIDGTYTLYVDDESQINKPELTDEQVRIKELEDELALLKLKEAN